MKTAILSSLCPNENSGLGIALVNGAILRIFAVYPIVKRFATSVLWEKET
jgi:hypothetical protein